MFYNGDDVGSQVFECHSFFGSPKRIGIGYMINVLEGRVATPPHIRVFAGQPDPSDATHITIHYQLWGQDDVVDAWVTNDEHVKFSVRNPPRQPWP
jgi:hypothetical protein